MKILQEWSKGKGVVMIDRLFKVLGKKSGETYKVCQIPTLYQNKWGRFAGYYVVASSGVVYRANFVLGKDSETVVSIDKFSASDEKLKVPVETLSLEGFNIVQIYNCVLDWMRGNGAALKESFERDLLTEAVDWKSEMVNFLQSQPNWLKDNDAGNLDQKKFYTAYKAFVASRGISTDIGGVSYAIKTLKTVLEKGLLGGNTKAAAGKVAIPAVFGGVVEKPAATNDDILAKYAGGDPKKWQDFLADLDSPSTSNPLGVIENYRQYIQDMAEVPDKTANGIVAWGKGGTGKTYHATQALKAEGLVENVHYVTITGKVDGGTEALYGRLYDISQGGYAFAIFDDADNIFEKHFRTTMLHALDTDAKNRVFKVAQKNVKTPEGRTIPVNEPFSVADCKFIFATNKDVSQLDSAFKSRLRSFNFDFNDDEMLQLIGQSLDTMLPEDPTLTKAIKLEVFQMVSAALEKKVAKRIDFRIITQCLQAYSLAVDRKRNPIKAVAEEIKSAV